jgi:C_GCAxxG_C_C family probable redox protein
MKEYADINKIKITASDYYRNGDFYCSEAIVKAVKDEFELEYTDEVIKLASGFPVGMGGSGCACGAIAGGIMAIGMVFGRSRPKSPDVDRTMRLSMELHEYFKRQYGSTCCRVLTKNKILGSPDHMDKCISITGEIAAETARLINTELKITNSAS